MSTHSYSDKLLDLHRNGEFETGIKYLQSLLKNDPENTELNIWLASFLYHFSFANQSASQELKEAINILTEVIDHNKNSRSKDELNARLFLAQIYSSIDCKKSIGLARENYKQFPGSLTSNRLADILLRCEHYDQAMKWYQVYHDQSLKEGKNIAYTYATLSVANQKMGKNPEAEQWLEKLSQSYSSLDSEQQRDMLLILTSAFTKKEIQKAGLISETSKEKQG